MLRSKILLEQRNLQRTHRIRKTLSQQKINSISTSQKPFKSSVILTILSEDLNNIEEFSNQYFLELQVPSLPHNVNIMAKSD